MPWLDLNSGSFTNAHNTHNTGDLIALQYLDISDNALTSLPEELGRLTLLTELHAGKTLEVTRKRTRAIYSGAIMRVQIQRASFPILCK